MKVIYAKLISEQILEAQVKAEEEGRRIEKIVLTQDEYEQLQEEIHGNYSISRKQVRTSKGILFCGVSIEVELTDF